MALYFERQITFDGFIRQEILDPSHKLVRLAGIVDWEDIHNRLSCYYSERGRAAKPIRLMVGLHILKHMEHESDDKCVDRLRGDVYWMNFCGVSWDELGDKYKHLDSTSMTKFRNRLGPDGWHEVEKVLFEYLTKEKKVNAKEMTTDSFCMEKHIAYPTDAGLLDKGRKNLLKAMSQLETLGVSGVEGVRSYARRSKKVMLNMVRLGKDRWERIKGGTLELASQSVHVLHKSEAMVRLVEKQIKKLGLQGSCEMKRWLQYLRQQQGLMRRVITQTRERFIKGIHVKDKVYSLHEPAVTCISKGKRSKKNEYGTKVNISTSRGYIVSHEIYKTNKSDADILEPALKNWESVTGRLPEQLNGDRGYCQRERKLKRGRLRDVDKVCIPKKGKKRHADHDKSWFRRGQRIRAAIEPVVGHLKNDHRLDRSRYKGFRGDKINVILGSLGWNLAKLAREMV